MKWKEVKNTIMSDLDKLACLRQEFFQDMVFRDRKNKTLHIFRGLVDIIIVSRERGKTWNISYLDIIIVSWCEGNIAIFFCDHDKILNISSNH